MAMQLGTYNYQVLARKDGGEVKPFHGVKDQRWHTVDRANSLAKAGWEIVDFQVLNSKGEYETDPKAHADYKKRYGGGTPEVTMEIDFIRQEELLAPLVDLGKIVTLTSQSINKGKLPVDTVNAMATQALHTLSTLGVTPEVLIEALKLSYPQLVSGGRKRDEQHQ